VVVGQERAPDRLAGGVVVPDRRGEREEALGDAGDDACGGAAAAPFQVELAFEGLVHRLDDLVQRPQEPAAGPGLVARAGRADQGDPGICELMLEGAAVVVLVGYQGLAAAPGQAGVAQDGQQDLPLVGFAPVSAMPTGRPCKVATRCSRSPQNHREWLAQYPYCAHPASSDRRAVSRDRPHSTGVESATQTSSDQIAVSAASSRVGWLIVPASFRSRLL
jgi:hypothetical protein